MLGLWIALVVIFAAQFYLLTGRLHWRCVLHGCARPVGEDLFLCDMHRQMIHNESRRVGQTAASSSAPQIEGDVPKTHDATPPITSGSVGYSSPAGLRLVHRCLDCRQPATYAPCSAHAGGLHRIMPGPVRLTIVPPYDQEESP